MVASLPSRPRPLPKLALILAGAVVPDEISSKRYLAVSSGLSGGQISRPGSSTSVIFSK